MPANASYIFRNLPSALCARGLSKSFARGLARAARRAVAIHDVDIDLRAGEILGVAGPEGAGKTTLLQCLCGLLKLDAGKIQVLGEPLDSDQWPPRVCYVPAVPVFYPFFTVRDVLESRLARAGFARGAERALSRTLSALDISSLERCRVSALSRETLRRLSIAEAIVTGPAVILVDTCASSFEPPVAAAALNALQECACAGMAVIIACRDASSVAFGATRIVLLDEGRVVRTFSLESLGEPVIQLPSAPGVSRLVAERVH